MVETAELESSAPGGRVPEDCADLGLGAFIAGLDYTAILTEALRNLEDGKKQVE